MAPPLIRWEGKEEGERNGDEVEERGKSNSCISLLLAFHRTTLGGFSLVSCQGRVIQRRTMPQ